MKEKIEVATNIYDSNPILKSLYFENFMIPESEIKEIDKSKIQLLVSAGGSGKTYSSVNGIEALKKIGKNVEYFDLEGKSTIVDLGIEKYETVVLDSLNESKEIEKIQNEIISIKNLNPDLNIIVCSRDTHLTDVFDSRAKKHKIDSRNSYLSFKHKYRNASRNLSSERKIIWSLLNVLYKEERNEMNLRTLRTLTEVILKGYRITSKDLVQWIRGAQENIIKQTFKEVNSKEEWDFFKKNIYNVNENAVELEKALKNPEIWIKYDFIRMNNGRKEVKDYNFIDNIIAFEIINSNKFVNKQNKSINERCKEIESFIDEIKNYNGSKRNLKAITIYTYIKRNANKNDVISETDWLDLQEIMISSTNRLYSLLFYDEEISSKIFSQTNNISSFTISNIDELVIALPLVNIKLEKMLPINPFYSSEVLDSISMRLKDEYINENSLINLFKCLIATELHEGENNYRGEYTDPICHIIEEVFFKLENKDLIDSALKSIVDEIKESTLDKKEKEERIYILLVFTKAIQDLAIKNGKKITIDSENFEILNKTYTFKSLNNIIKTKMNYNNTTRYFNENDDKYIGHFSEEWTQVILRGICYATSTTIEYHTNKEFIEFTKDFSKNFTNVDKEFSYRDKNQYIYDDNPNLSRHSIRPLIKFDEYLLNVFDKYFKIIDMNTDINIMEEEGVFFNVIDGPYYEFDGERDKIIDSKHIDATNSFNDDEMMLINSMVLWCGDGEVLGSLVKEYLEIIKKHNIYVGNSIYSKINGKNIWNRPHAYFSIDSDEIREKWKEYQSGNYQDIAKKELQSSSSDLHYYDDNNSLYFYSKESKGNIWFRLERAYVDYGDAPSIKNRPSWEYIQGKVREDGEVIYAVTSRVNSHIYDSVSKTKRNISNGYDRMDFMEEVTNF